MMWFVLNLGECSGPTARSATIPCMSRQKGVLKRRSLSKRLVAAEQRVRLRL
ncbi:hypothetical protein [Larkinella sp.]|uniref:hypothetical protein n=1 Tax=Larkinella sp. TaxID=2034517 RepID=UPI003BA91E30